MKTKTGTRSEGKTINTAGARGRRIAFAPLLLLVISMNVSLQAARVILISDAYVPGVAGGNHNDDSLVSFLEGLGHTVDFAGSCRHTSSFWSQNGGPKKGAITLLTFSDRLVSIQIPRRSTLGSNDWLLEIIYPVAVLEKLKQSLLVQRVRRGHDGHNIAPKVVMLGT